VHVLVDQSGLPIVLKLTAGQIHRCVAFARLCA
jgi:transposase